MNKLTKTLLVYSGLSVFLVAFDNVYALFGHGVRSVYMSLASPALLAAALPFGALRLFCPGVCAVRGYRLFLNIHSTGAALLTNGMLLRGVLDIAGGSSEYVPWFFVCAGASFVAGFAVLSRVLTRYGHARAE
jgi:hypothetical protein